jgi:hypothetical protein
MTRLQHTLSKPLPAAPATSTYLQVLTWLFTLFNSVRVFAYLPTLWTVYTSGDSSQRRAAGRRGRGTGAGPGRSAERKRFLNPSLCLQRVTADQTKSGYRRAGP